MKKIKKIAIFLAARSGSKRLPNKHFFKLNKNLNVIDLCISRLKKAKLVKKIILCTPKKREDFIFKNVSRKHQIILFMGNEKNVLKRFVDCAKKNSIETIVRITADCPLIDPKLIDKCIYAHFKKNNDYTTNTLKLTYPDGLDVEVVKLKALISSLEKSKTTANKEHVTTFIRKSKFYKKYNIVNKKNYSNRRWTLDTKKDFLFLKKVIGYFSKNIHFDWMDLIKAEKNNQFLVNLKQR